MHMYTGEKEINIKMSQENEPPILVFWHIFQFFVGPLQHCVADDSATTVANNLVAATCD